MNLDYSKIIRSMKFASLSHFTIICSQAYTNFIELYTAKPATPPCTDKLRPTL